MGELYGLEQMFQARNKSQTMRKHFVPKSSFQNTILRCFYCLRRVNLYEDEEATMCMYIFYQ